MAYSLGLGYDGNRIDIMMDDVTLAMLGFLVCFAIALIIYGISSDRRKIKEVKIMVETAKNYVRCGRCLRWTDAKLSNTFEEIGILCPACSKMQLSMVTELPVPVKKKSSGFMNFVKGNQDEY